MRARILKTLPTVHKKMPFELRPEDGFIKKPKHVADLIIFSLFYRINVALDRKLVYILLTMHYYFMLYRLKHVSAHIKPSAGKTSYKVCTYVSV
jgi:hypothetical protein